MADISMCKGQGCPKKESCYRFKATPNPYRQTYCGFDLQEGECEYFYPITK